MKLYGLKQSAPPCQGWEANQPAPCSVLKEPQLTAYETEVLQLWQQLHQRGRAFGLSVSPILIEPTLHWCKALGFGVEEAQWVFFLDELIYPHLIASNEQEKDA